MRYKLLIALERLCRRYRILKWVVLAIYHGGRIGAAASVPVLFMTLSLAFYAGGIYLAVYVAVIAARHAGAIP